MGAVGGVAGFGVRVGVGNLKSYELDHGCHHPVGVGGSQILG